MLEFVLPDPGASYEIPAICIKCAICTSPLRCALCAAGRWSLVAVLYAQFPELVNDQGGTRNTPLLLATELLQLLILAICGYAVALISQRHPRHHVVIATVVMLAIGVAVQLSFWESAPAWHHYVFFACILGGMTLGGHIRVRQPGAPS